RAEEFVPDRFGKGRAEDRDRGGEHHARLIAAADGAYRLEEPPRAVEVDAVALVEIRLCLAGDDGGEVKDELRPGGEQLFRLAECRKIRRQAAPLVRGP